jgi:predicted HicB family RNase H-like nuclease
MGYAIMMNRMVINGYSAVIQYDPDIELFRGEFTCLNGGADFYAKDIESLKREGEISLQVFLDACKARGIEPKKTFSGKFNVRIPESLHAAIVNAASAEGKSLNQWVTEALGREVSA